MAGVINLEGLAAKSEIVLIDNSAFEPLSHCRDDIEEPVAHKNTMACYASWLNVLNKGIDLGKIHMTADGCREILSGSDLSCARYVRREQQMRKRLQKFFYEEQRIIDPEGLHYYFYIKKRIRPYVKEVNRRLALEDKDELSKEDVDFMIVGLAKFKEGLCGPTISNDFGILGLWKIFTKKELKGEYVDFYIHRKLGVFEKGHLNYD